MIRSSCLALALAPLLFAGAAVAEPYLLADADTGDVLLQSDATEPWFPASTTKLMTTYVALSAVRDGRLTMDTPLTMSSRASNAPPSKMGFRPGTLVTLDNALKMLMVKSPNDVAVMVGESLSGSVEGFAAEMNAAAAKLGMHESHFVNPNGLHDPDHYSSPRDMAILARALIKEFPDHSDLFSIGELQLGDKIIRNHNGMLGHYPGADGMKTGFTCPAGWNIVATAQRNGRKLIAVVFGAPSPRIRNDEAALLFDRGFDLATTGQKLDALPASAITSPPNMRDAICRGHGKARMFEMQEDFVSAMPGATTSFAVGRGGAPGPLLNMAMEAPPHAAGLSDEGVTFAPVPVFVGPKPGWAGPVLAARGGEPESGAPVSAFAADKEAAKPEESAKAAIRSSVKPVARLRPLRLPPHLTPEARARVVAASHRVAAKKSQRP
jgi:D-alanyl-D-alanine carboxypeptidase